MRTAALLIFVTACSTSSGTAATAPPSPDAGAADAAPAIDAPAACTAALPSDIPIANVDLQGYPPYAADGCSLVYVAPGTPGDLRLRDLATGSESTIAPASESPRHPSIAGDVIAWEAKDADRAVVRVRANGATTTMSGGFDHAGEPRAAADGVVFTVWRSADALSDTDVLLYDVAAARADVVFDGPAQQRFADVSRGYVAAADFSEDPDGVYNDNETDVADIIFYDRGTRAVSHRPRAGKQAFPLLVSPTRFGYLDWGEVHPEPKFAEYTLRVGDIQGDVSADVTVALVKNDYGQYILPSGRDGILEWVDRPNGVPSLWRVPADMSRSPAVVGGLDGLDLYAPTSGGWFSLLATMPIAGGTIVLRGVSR